MRILLHTQYYPPEVGAPQNRLSDLARELQSLGHQVAVLTAMPNYPTGKIYPGYGGISRRETLDGIPVHRAWILPSISRSLLPRLVSYFSFVLSSLLVGLFLPKFDLILTESPPLFLGISGYLLSRIQRARWIFNISDLWPASAVELGMIQPGSTGYKVGIALEKFLYSKAWLVTGQSKTILADISRRFPGVNIYHLSNGVNVAQFAPVENSQPAEKLRVIYAGLHGLAQGLDQVLAAVALLRDMDHFEVLFIGDGPEKQKLTNMARSLGLEMVQFLEPLPKSRMPAVLSAADILIVPLKVQLTGAVPSKLYEAMAMAKPVVLVAESEAAAIVQEAKCGLVVRPGDVSGIADALRFLLTHSERRRKMGANGRVAALEKYDRAAIARNFSRHLQDLVQEER